ncbi:MAG: hypothetical protein Unbinned7913contig1002_18 [Prokaryotic dsDNA virus sp.]|jgi:hypothetical protein|nr:hypothetical protein [Parcubacteria group bacterium]QDP51263.1 MAG: hypothetical protein Unbinned7913contig1002_18 [Prokaryotic dsDNA virus sp.]|tara:strand:- start:1139 stop:1537 length:399 start_codon:yes stop_codon:yes gene_type:complete
MVYRFVYLGDYLGDLNEECNDIKVEIQLKLSISNSKPIVIKIIKQYPKALDFDVLFFDWGGASIGNSMMDHYCRDFIRDAKENSNKLFVMTSTMTAQYMGEELDNYLPEDRKLISNIFLNITDALPYIKTYL